MQSSFVDTQHGVGLQYCLKTPSREIMKKNSTKESQEFIKRKKNQHLLKTKLKIRVFFVWKGSVTSNAGNVARKIFNSSVVAGKILNFDVSMIQLFKDLLIHMSSTTTRPDIKFLKHKKDGVSFIDYFKFPIGSLSESAIKDRNKANKSAGAVHARLTSFAKKY